MNILIGINFLLFFIFLVLKITPYSPNEIIKIIRRSWWIIIGTIGLNLLEEKYAVVLGGILFLFIVVLPLVKLKDLCKEMFKKVFSSKSNIIELLISLSLLLVSFLTDILSVISAIILICLSIKELFITHIRRAA